MKKTKNEAWTKQAGKFLSSSPFPLWVMLFTVTALFTLSQVPPEKKQITFSYQIGDVAKRDVKAHKDFFIEDKEVTRKRKNEIRESVKIVYDFDAGLLTEISSNVDEAMALGQKLFITSPDITADPQGLAPLEPTFAQVLETKPAFEEKLGIELSKGAYNILYKYKFSQDISDKIKAIVEKILTNGVVANKDILLKEESKGIILRTIQTNEEKVVTNLKVFYGPDQAKAMVRIEGEPILKKENYNLSNLIVDICQALLVPNITLNKNETEKRILNVQSTIKPVMYQIKSGEIILREGDVVDKLRLMKLNALEEQTEEKTVDVTMAVTGVAMTTFSLILIVYFLFLKTHKALQKSHNKHMLFLALGLMLYLGFVQTAIYLAQSANPETTWEVATSSFYMIIPVPGAAMIACLFLGFDIALYFTIVLSILASLSFGGNFQIFLFFFLSSITAAYWIRERQERKNFILAGFKLAIINAVLAITLGFYTQSQTELLLLAKEVMLAFCGGLLAATLTIGFTPLIELLFDYTTETKLLEFSHLDQPLIKKLMIEAPGTYNHSLIVATLAEAAASAISASGLKAKVMGYYHDIGKLDKPMYFIENQADGKNRHDKLSPSMSALILIQHVKKGAELAKKYKLGSEVIEGIAQHHGTSLIKYFYNKSLKSGNENINEEDFRYPGPRPQTREAGIVMLADVVEAAVRALERPTPARIKGRVKELINDIFADGQLEECELTLKDLHEIAKSFNTILTSIYHNRIEYIEKPQEKKKEKNGLPKDPDRQPARNENPNPAPVQKDRTDLKRLGL